MLKFDNELEKRTFLFDPLSVVDLRKKSINEGLYGPSIHIINNIDKIEETLKFIKSFTEKTRVTLTLINENSNVKKEDIETILFKNCFIKSFIDYSYFDYQEIKNNQNFLIGTYNYLGNINNAKKTYNWLINNRDLHMDMLRETGPRSDAHTYRYVWASNYIRESDFVMDCASGLGYGAYLISKLSKSKSVLGLDICSDSVNYANQTYGSNDLSFNCFDLDNVAAANFPKADCIISFETIEHLKNYDNFFKFSSKHLKPDGRLIVSVPYMWVDESGKDPNPYHFHEFDWLKLKTLFLSYGYLIEKRYAQTAPGGFKLANALREFIEIDPERGELDTEWVLVVATPDLSNPIWKHKLNETKYLNPEYDFKEIPKYIDFANSECIPWFHRQIVQIGQRIASDDKRKNYGEELLRLDLSMCDKLMLNTVIGYSTVEPPTEWFEQNLQLLELAEKQLKTPFLLRWSISLRYLIGYKLFNDKKLSEAQQIFSQLENIEVSEFTPLLVTKTSQSSVFLAIICLYKNDVKTATSHLEKARINTIKAIEELTTEIKNNNDKKAPFLWTEMAEIMDLGDSINRCIITLEKDNLTKAKLNIIKIINSRRFGLFDLTEKLLRLVKNKGSSNFEKIFKVIEANIIKKIQSIRPEKVAFWGISPLSKQLESSLADCIKSNYFFIDSTPEKHSEASLGKKILTPEKAFLEKPDLIIICSVASGEKISNSIPKNIPNIYINIKG